MTDDPQPETPAQPPRRSLWTTLKLHILHPEMTPHQVALSFAIGFSLAWNPILGLHTTLVLLICLVFRGLHRPMVLLACYINNPWTLVPMASASALVGNVLLGRGWHLNLHGVHWRSIGWKSFVTRAGFDGMLTMLKPILVPYLVGGIVLSAVALPVGYYLMLKAAQRLRKIHLPHLHLPHLHKHTPPK